MFNRKQSAKLTDARPEAMAKYLPWWDIKDNGYIVAADRGARKTLVAVVRLDEPDTLLMDIGQVFASTIVPLDVHFRTEDAIGVGQQLQILRQVSYPTDGHPVVEGSVDFPSPNVEEAARILREFVCNRQRQGAMPIVHTHLFLSYDFDKRFIQASERREAENELAKRLENLGAAFDRAGYGFERVKDPRVVMEVLWRYCKPKTSQRVAAPWPKSELAHGQLADFTLRRHPELALDSIRRQLSDSYAFSYNHCTGDDTVQALLSLATLPDSARSGFAPLFLLASAGHDMVISQCWRNDGKKRIGDELEKRQFLAEDLMRSFGDRVSNSGLGSTVEGIEKLRRDITEATNIIRYCLTIRVQAEIPECGPNPEDPKTPQQAYGQAMAELERAVAAVTNAGNSAAGATFHREKFAGRVQRAWLCTAPGIPQALVDYKHRGHVIRADRATWFIPRYGEPPSDVLTPGEPYTLLWSPSGNVVRKANWGYTRGSLVLIWGPQGFGKSTLAKAMAGQLQCEENTYTWFTDNNLALTSYDFFVSYHGGRNIRFSDQNPVSIDTFDIAGGFPTPREQALLIEVIWFDIHRKWVDRPGEMESLLATALYRTYRSTPRPTYDDLVEVLRNWEDPVQKKEMKRWALSLEAFCSSEYLSKIKGVTDHPAGQYWTFFGKREGLRVQDLQKWRVVHWNLQELSNEYLKKKTALMLKKMSLSFAELQGRRSVKEGKSYFLDVFMDEGWKLLTLDGGEFLTEVARRHRHYKLRLYFMTQYLEDLLSPEGQIVLKSANHWFMLGSQDGGKAEKEILGLTDVEADRCAATTLVPGVAGDVLWRRKLSSGELQTHLLINAIPYTSDGSWVPLITGERKECELREKILQALGAKDTEDATTDQCRVACDIFGRVWPNGLPSSKEDRYKLTREAGWVEVEKMLEQYKLARRYEGLFTEEDSHGAQ